jgi:hypothetical protein
LGKALPLVAKRYFYLIQEALRLDSSYALRSLIGAKDGASESQSAYRVTGWSALQAADSPDRYCRTYTRLMAMLLRRQSNARFAAFPPVLTSYGRLVTDLHSLLSAPLLDMDRTLLVFHRISMALWSEEAPVLSNQDSKCPVYLYLAFSAFHANGTFQETHLLTQPMAHLQYWARTVVFTEIINTFPQAVHDGEMQLVRERLPPLLALLEERAFTSFGTLRRLMHLCFHVAGRTIAQPTVDWVHGSAFRSMSVSGYVISIDTLGKLCRDVMALAQDKLTSDLLLGLPTKLSLTLFLRHLPPCAVIPREGIIG